MDHHTDFALERLDRGVRRAVDAWGAWQERLAADALGDAFEDQPPLARHRSVAGKTAFDEVGALKVIASAEEWRGAVRRWVGALAVLRIGEELRTDEARIETEASAMVRLERVARVSFRRAVRGLVGSRNAAEASAWLGALVERGPAVSAARRERAAREEEAVSRLGFGTLEEVVGGAPRAELDAAARVFLAKTSDLATALRRDAERAGDDSSRQQPASFAGVLIAATARDAPEGWPARLSLRTLVETLHAPGNLGRGLRIQARLGEPVGAASFARALSTFGEAYRRAAASASRLPFALAVDPSFVDAHRFGFAFGALATQTAYQRQGLGVVARVAIDQARTLARTALLHARSVAMAALLSRHAARPDAGLFEELTADLYGSALPRALVGAFPRLRGDEPARLLALLTTVPFLELLRDRFDEDWFRNPRAWDYLRGRASGPARVEESVAKVQPEALALAFEKALG